MKLINYRDETIILEKDTKEHIQEFHPEVTLQVIKQTLLHPDEVRESSSHPTSELYYLFKKEDRYSCVVVKVCPDGNFISTALTTSQIKKGKLVFKAGGK